MTGPTTPEEPRRSHVGTVSLGVAVAGAVASHVAQHAGLFPGALWLRLVIDGFEASLVGGLADWFAVTALFRRPLGLPIPHTAIIPENRPRIIDGIVTTVEKQWLSPEVIASRLERLAPSTLVVEWLRDAEHVTRLGGPLRDLLRELARLLDEPEVARFAERAIVRQLREVPIDASTGSWLAEWAESETMGEGLRSVALSLVRLAERPRTAQELHWWLLRSAKVLEEKGKRLVPMLLRTKFIQRRLVEAVLAYASSELKGAAEDPAHPLRRFVVEGLQRYAARLGAGDAEAIAELERVRVTLVESLEVDPLVGNALGRLRAQLESELGDPASSLSKLVNTQIRAAVLGWLDDAAHRAAFDRWVRTTAADLVRRNHHQIGITVRENLEQLDDQTLVAQIEGKVGADLQFIRLNGALVGGLIGIGLSLLRWLAA